MGKTPELPYQMFEISQYIMSVVNQHLNEGKKNLINALYLSPLQSGFNYQLIYDVISQRQDFNVVLDLGNEL